MAEKEEEETEPSYGNISYSDNKDMVVSNDNTDTCPFPTSGWTSEARRAAYWQGLVLL